MTTLWLPGVLFQPLLGIFILRKSFVVKCAQIQKGSESRWAIPPRNPVSSGIAFPFERFIIICSWLRVGLWWLFPGDFQPELQGAQAPSSSCPHGGQGWLYFLHDFLCPARGSQETELVWPWASLFTSLSVSVATETFSNVCSQGKVRDKLPKYTDTHL